MASARVFGSPRGGPPTGMAPRRLDSAARADRKFRTESGAMFIRRSHRTLLGQQGELGDNPRMSKYSKVTAGVQAHVLGAGQRAPTRDVRIELAKD